MSSTEKLYPYDMNIWTRSCEQEIKEPLTGKITGSIPSWLKGTLIRNGPGCNKLGDSQYEHVFDGLALLHRFAINKGKVTYQCKFVHSETYKRNTAAKRIVVTEFGTAAVPDPCQSIFDRISSTFSLNTEKTDNTAVSVYPFGDQIYAMTELPVMYKIDPKSLETIGKEQIEDALVVSHTAHPHVMPNGDVYNVGLSKSNGLKYAVVKFTHNDEGDMFDSAEVVATITPRWKLNPAYMHSFGITDNYFIIIEQPLVISMLAMVRRLFINLPFASVLTSYPDEETQIVLIHKKTGIQTRYTTDTIFFMHIINCFELNNKVNVDMCSYTSAKIIDSMYISAIKSMQNNPDYGQWCQCLPKRIELPLDAPDSKVEAKLLADIGCETPRINYEVFNGRPYRYFYGIGSDIDKIGAGCLVKVDTTTGDFETWQELDSYPSEPIFVARLGATEEDDGVLLSALVWGSEEHSVTLLVLDARNMTELARAHFDTPSQSMQNNPDYGQWCQCLPKRIELPLDAPDSKVEAKLLADIGCETPRINYEVFNGRPYRYFYGIGSDIDKIGAGCLVKVDTTTGDFETWQELDSYPSEPIFVARPGATEEDDGVLLSALVWGSEEHSVTLLVLDARNMTELARAHFDTPSQVPKCFHGWFLCDQSTE